MATIKCSNCGLNNNDTAATCPRCGASVAPSGQPAYQPGNATQWSGPYGTNQSPTVPQPIAPGYGAPLAASYGAPPAAQNAAPYAGGYGAPSAVGYGAPPGGGYAYGGLWRDGSTLVMYKGAVLPDRCVKCGNPANGRRLLRNLAWHPPALALLVILGLLGIIAYAIIASIIKKTASVEIGLCEDHLAARRTAMIISSILAIAGVVGIAVAVGESSLVVGLLGLVLLIAGGVIAGSPFGAKVVRASKIDDHYVWMKGIGKDYLAQLPALPR